MDFPALIGRQKITRPLYQAYTGEQIPTQIRLDNDASETRTVIEIETEDRIGLLYTISQTLTELALDISAAKICTERGAAMDSFYVRELSGGKVLDARTPARHRAEAPPRHPQPGRSISSAPGPIPLAWGRFGGRLRLACISIRNSENGGLRTRGALAAAWYHPGPPCKHRTVRHPQK